MKFCTNCGKENAPTAKFCSNCGTMLENDQNVESIVPSDAFPNPATVSRFSNLKATFLHTGRLRSSIRIRFLAIAVFVCAIFGLGLMPISKTTASPFMKNMVPIPGRPFMMGRTEVTQAQWESIMGNNPSENKGPDLPVENVSWYDCQRFIEKLNAQTGKEFRLPTEEEWEYACRAGGTGDWGKRANGEEGPLDTMGWYEDNSDRCTHPVGQKEPNAFGLYDMHGNVDEWTVTAGGAGRVLRGGSYRDCAGFCAASSRCRSNPFRRRSRIGFRLACDRELTAAEQARKEKELVESMVPIPGRPFMMGRTEVTQAQWAAIMGDNPSNNKGPDLPVENVSWNDCQEFIKKLNEMTGKKFRLPTGDEWEYACRAGGTGDWGKRANGEEGPLGAMGWYDGNSDDHTHPVGQKEPNAFGLYDMHGNVWEWTTTADGANRVLRGGSYWNGAGGCTASDRDWDDPGNRYSWYGFRLALSQD